MSMRRPMSVLAAAAAVLSALFTQGVAAAAPAGTGVAEYVSLGDSYVALGSVPTTRWSADCQQAPDDVGARIAARLRVSFVDAACAGAATDDVVAGGRPQIRALTPSTRYVTLSIGGNDDGFFQRLVEQCFAAPTCPAAVRTAAHRALAALPAGLDGVHAAVRRAAPAARVVVIGYPPLFPAGGVGCPGGSLLRDRIDFLIEVQRELAAIVAGAASRAGFRLVDGAPDGRHTMCAPDGRRYVALTGLWPGENGVPVHPTAAGRAYVARVATAALLREE